MPSRNVMRPQAALGVRQPARRGGLVDLACPERVWRRERSRRAAASFLQMAKSSTPSTAVPGKNVVRPQAALGVRQLAAALSSHVAGPQPQYLALRFARVVFAGSRRRFWCFSANSAPACRRPDSAVRFSVFAFTFFL